LANSNFRGLLNIGFVELSVTFTPVHPPLTPVAIYALDLSGKFLFMLGSSGARIAL